jgi:hypothetical protein
MRGASFPVLPQAGQLRQEGLEIHGGWRGPLHEARRLGQPSQRALQLADPMEELHWIQPPLLLAKAFLDLITDSNCR